MMVDDQHCSQRTLDGVTQRLWHLQAVLDLLHVLHEVDMRNIYHRYNHSGAELIW